MKLTLNVKIFTVSEMVFHPLHPEHLFTCSSSGQLWHWNTVKNIRGNSVIKKCLKFIQFFVINSLIYFRI